MDANQTRFHLLLGRADWTACAYDAHQLEWDEARDELRLRERAYLFVAAPRDRRLSLADRRGAGCDAYGNWYWIADDQGGIMVRSVGSGQSARFWPAGAGAPEPTTSAGGDFRPAVPAPPVRLTLRGLAVTREQYLVVGVVEPAGLLIFDLHAGGPPRRVVWPTPFAPFDMAPTHDGGLWVLDRPLDRTPSDPPARCWALDRHLQIIRVRQAAPGPAAAPDFRPQPPALGGPPSARLDPAVAIADAATPLPAADPVAIVALPDGTALILDNGGDGEPGPACAIVWHHAIGRTCGEPVSLRPMLERIDLSGGKDVDLLGHAMAAIPGAGTASPDAPGLLLVVTPGGNQSFAFVLERAGEQLTLRPLTDYLPMRLFGGKGLATDGARAYYDLGDAWLPLVRQPRARYAEEGTLLTPIGTGVSLPPGGAEASPHAFDSQTPGCVWHRLLFDGCLPLGATLGVRSRAADTEAELSCAEWQLEPGFYQRSGGSELPFSRGAALPDEATWELLLQRAHGRYLQLALTLQGDGRNTPRLRALRIYYPRFSYLERYLPGAYRANPASAAFLDRFLANIEGFYTALEDKIAAAQLLFDARTAPPEYLDWLAGWFGVVFDPAWEEQRRRLFLRHAPQIFSQRGTVPGMIRALRLATDANPDESIFSEAISCTQPAQAAIGAGAIRIVEDFATRRAPGVIFGDTSQIEGPGLTTTISDWSPEQGLAPLHRRFGQYLCAYYGQIALISRAWEANWGSIDQIALPAAQLADGARHAAWRSFLQQRYYTIAALNTAWGTAHTSFVGLKLPSSRPGADPAAADWHTFLALDALNGAWGSAYSGFEAITLMPTRPSGAARLDDWRRFLRAGLGFTYAESGSEDVAAYRNFLRRRYRQIDSLNRDYRLGDAAYQDFAQIALPAALPEGGKPLRDWIQFVSVLLPTARKAHRFTVLVPAQMQQSAEDRGPLTELVRRVVNLEKPAHTTFDVKEYWALFRVGEARLGLDSLLGSGSRLTALVLDHSFLAQSYLSPAHPWSVRNRTLLGRDSIGGGTQL